jgi:hypothetical protein
MATHHGGLRRACPALFGRLTASPGEQGSEADNPTQARRTSAKMRCCFTRGNDLAWSPPQNSIEVWQSASVLHVILVH